MRKRSKTEGSERHRASFRWCQSFLQGVEKTPSEIGETWGWRWDFKPKIRGGKEVLQITNIWADRGEIEGPGQGEDRAGKRKFHGRENSIRRDDISLESFTRQEQGPGILKAEKKVTAVDTLVAHRHCSLRWSIRFFFWRWGWQINSSFFP